MELEKNQEDSFWESMWYYEFDFDICQQAGSEFKGRKNQQEE